MGADNNTLAIEDDYFGSTTIYGGDDADRVIVYGGINRVDKGAIFSGCVMYLGDGNDTVESYARLESSTINGDGHT